MLFKSGWRRGVAWLALGVGAIAAGVLAGYLINGPPSRPAARVETAVAPRELTVEPPPVASPPAASPPTASEVAREPATAEPAAPPPGQLAAGEVRELQGRLRAIGFNPGPVDGSAGPLTVNAARQYQRTRGLAVTGAIDRDLLGRLRQERRASSATRTAQAQPHQRNDFLASLDRLFRR